MMEVYRQGTAQVKGSPVGTTFAVQQSGTLALRYREEFSWSVVPAHRAKARPDGTIVCSCRAKAACQALGKHPFYAWREVRGSLTLKRIEEEWTRHPWANVAVLTGKRSDVLVADVDPRHGGSLDSLWALGWPPLTPIECTGGGGWHVYVQCPPDGLASVDGYAPGIEVKADGKLVIAAPSLHPSGRRYAWLEGLSPWEVPVAPLPEEVLRSLARPVPVAVDVVNSEGMLREMRGNAPLLVKRAVARARAGRDGGRHNTGVWLACQLRDLRVSDEDGATLMLAYQKEVEALA